VLLFTRILDRMGTNGMETRPVLLVGNGRLITRDERRPLIEDGCVAIEEDRIVAVGNTNELQRSYPGARFVDAHGRLIMPGLINTHMHLYSTFARGMALKDSAPGNFVDILERLWWRLDKALGEEDVYLSAMVAMVECIRNGTTTIFDHHSSPGAVRGSLFRIAEAARETGVRSCLCYEVTDREGWRITDDSIEENREFLLHCEGSDDAMLRGLFGLHASFTVSDETMARCRKVAGRLNAGFHIHVAEAESDVEDCERQYGKRVVERLADFGILGRKTVAAHCVHVDEREIDLLRESETGVVHNPESNMANAVGCAPVMEMMQRGVRVGLGSDGYTFDMFESLKVANMLHKHEAGRPSVGWCEPPAMLFQENARIASECFGQPMGKLMPGAAADVIVVDYQPPTPLHAGNCDSHILFGASGRAVDTTIIGGRIAMQNRRVFGVDEEELMAKAKVAAAKLWHRY
jgi:putative selenium metabolism protein SsnA